MACSPRRRALNRGCRFVETALEFQGEPLLPADNDSPLSSTSAGMPFIQKPFPLQRASEWAESPRKYWTAENRYLPVRAARP